MGRSLRLGVSLRQREGQQACWPETTALSPILNNSEGRVPSPPERPPRMKKQDVWGGCLHGLHQSTGSTCRVNARLRASLRVQGRGECLPGAAELGSQSWGQGRRGQGAASLTCGWRNSRCVSFPSSSRPPMAHGLAGTCQQHLGRPLWQLDVEKTWL